MLQLLEERPFFEKLSGTSKKLVLVLATFVPVIDSSKEVVKMLASIIWFDFWKARDKKARNKSR